MAIHSDVEGWGVDKNPADRPAVPKERTPPRAITPGLKRPTQQRPRNEVLVSNEHAGITRVFGTAVAPRGLSGIMRRAAFRYSEGDLRHWLILLAADRVDVVEGVIDDLRHGHVPNFFKEMGWKAELRHRPVRGVLKLAVTFGGLALAAFALTRQTRKRTYFQRLLKH
ncbi:MAG: hypothetical protein JNK82_01885 [Myxococcaceae bacterium]|nr:hypothetical protein [Myxococcaceae bacterium]